MSGLKVWLIRHGETNANLGVWNTNPHEVLLTKKGEKQAQEAADKIIMQPDLLVVSPLKRARDSAMPIIDRWNQVVVETWPIQEFTYLSPVKYSNKTQQERRDAIESYWQHLDPYYRDGDDVESFDDFMKRVQQFYARLLAQNEFIVAVGHGQFFKAFMMNKAQEYHPSSNWMELFRKNETEHPIKNGEIIHSI